SSEKRVSAVAISGNDSHVCYADKFGVVWVVELDGISEGKVLQGFVTCIAFVWNPELPQGYLMSGSGDSTVRLWDVTYLGLFLTHVKLVQCFQGIVLLSSDLSAHTLSITNVIKIPGESFIPTSISLSTSTTLLWMVSGASNGSNHPAGYSRVRVISGIETGPSSVLEDELIPGGTKLLEKLQGKVSVEESVMSAAAEAVRAAMSSLLMKKQYSDEKREFRKRSRNDKKTTH
uniref:Uncharacterized protein n=1 Tax=Brassica oleracea var. oleracea TaxID=109376 RepID=A0A0D3C794_BRAOL